MPTLEPILFWHWWALAGVLVIVEVFAPGIMFLWLGMAAGLVGALLLLWPGLGLKGQILLFAALSVASVLAWRRHQKAHPVVTDEPNLNRRGAASIGPRAALATAIVNGRGRSRPSPDAGERSLGRRLSPRRRSHTPPFASRPDLHESHVRAKRDMRFSGGGQQGRVIQDDIGSKLGEDHPRAGGDPQ